MSDSDDSKRPLVFVDSSSALETLRATLATESMLALDTEADSLFSYFDKVCLLQLSTRGADYIVDPLAFPIKESPILSLASILADPSVEKIFHASEYDILCLKRDYGFSFANIFDTMVAARILGWKNIGLGNTLQERFGITLNKKMQRADWGHRPLSEEQLSYAREDTRHLLRLRDLQMDELEKRGYVEEALEEFRRLTRVEPSPRRFDPDGYWSVNGARDLDPVSLGILRELYRFRDAQARKEDRPPFKIVTDANMLVIAQARPSSLQSLGKVAGISEFILRRYSRAILDGVARGFGSPQVAQPHPRSRGEEFLDNAARNRLGKLKEWRKQRAEARGVENDVIVSNDVLHELARKNPHTMEAIVAATGLGPWKTREYGEEMLAVLQGKKS
jgi:ribonuclease D